MRAESVVVQQEISNRVSARKLRSQPMGASSRGADSRGTRERPLCGAPNMRCRRLLQGRTI